MAEWTELVRVGRAAFGQRDWTGAREAFRQAAAIEALAADDVFALADCAWWLGKIDEALEAYEQAHRLYLEDGIPSRAAMASLLLGAHAMERGDHAVGSGWMGRARRLLRDAPEGAEHGYPLYWELFDAMGRGDLEQALALAGRMQDLGQRFADTNLVAVGVMGEGRALVKQGEVSRGMALLDEAMVTALSDELHPLWTGVIYCHLMDVCHELVDVQRAGEWTEATASWCDTVGEAVVYRGICRVHRAQVFQRQGAWEDAEQAAIRASDDLEGVHVGTAAEAHYELGELHRLRGDLLAAEHSFRRAHELGREPQPGLALLQASRHRTDAACTSLRSALAERADDRLGRVRLCAALVEVALAAGEVETARAASAELRATARAYDSAGLDALAQQAQGAVLLAEGQAEDALRPLRTACRLWREEDAPYDAARTRLLLTQAYQALDDEDAAALELDAAQVAFELLGAGPDARRADQLRDRPKPPGGLSQRELEVLRLVATGKTNQQVAADLYISDKTVARHLANIYTKLGLSTRAAATAYAFEHGLVHPGA